MDFAWYRYRDPKSGAVFYHQPATCKSTWEAPATFTTPSLEKEEKKPAAAATPAATPQINHELVENEFLGLCSELLGSEPISSASWWGVLPKLSRDSRFVASPLSLAGKQAVFKRFAAQSTARGGTTTAAPHVSGTAAPTAAPPAAAAPPPPPDAAPRPTQRLLSTQASIAAALGGIGK